MKVTGNTSDFDKAMAGLERTLGRTGAKFQSIGRDLTIGLTAPLVGIAGLSIKVASDFESSFAGVRKTVDGVVDAGGNLTGFGKKLQGEFRALAMEIPISVNELNKIGESAGQLGIKSESILSFTKTIAAMGVATNLSAEQAADGMARFANITQMPQDNFERLGSVIVELGNKLEATESEILEFGLRIAGAGEIVGMTEAQIMGIGAAFASVGIEAEAGGTAVQKALLDMNSAVQTGKGLDAFGGAAFAQQFNADPGEAFAGFIDKVGAAGKGGEQVLRDAGINDSRQIRAFLSMAAAGDKLRESLKLAGDEWVRNKALAFEAEQRYRTFASQLTIFKAIVNDMAITIGTQLIESFLKLKPAIENVLGALTGMVNFFAGLPESVQTASFAFGAFLAALGPISWAFGLISSTGAAVVSLLRWIGILGAPAGAAAGTASLGIRGLWLSLAPFAAPAAILAGIAAVAYALQNLARQEISKGSGIGNLISRSLGAGDIRPGLMGPQRTADIALGSGAGNFDIDGLIGGNSAIANAPIVLSAAKAKLSEFEQAVNSLGDRLGGSGVVDSANQWIAAIDRIGGIGKLTKDELASFTKEIETAVAKLKALGQEVPRTWQIIANASEDAEAMSKSREALGKFFKPNDQNLLLNSSTDSAQTDMLRVAMGAQAATLAIQGVSHEADAMAARFSVVTLMFEDLGFSIADNFASAIMHAQSFKDAFVGIWTSIKQSITNILSDVLNMFVGGLLKGMLGAITGHGGAFSQAFSGMLGGSGSLAKMFGLGGSAAAGTAASGAGSAGGVAAGVGGGIGVGSALALTGGIAGAAALAWAIYKKGLFRGGEEALKVNQPRDEFISQFGGAGTGEGSGFQNLAAKLSSITGEEGGGALFRALTQSDTKAEYEAAVTAINAKLEESKASSLSVTTALGESSTALATLGTTQQTVVDSMLVGLNALIAKLGEFVAVLGAANGMALPSVTGSPQLDGVAPLDIPSFANEGVVSRPTLAMIGDAPEPEYVLRQSTVEALRSGGRGSSGGGPTIIINGPFLGPEEWIRTIVTDGVLNAIRGGGKRFSQFSTLVGEAT